MVVAPPVWLNHAVHTCQTCQECAPDAYPGAYLEIRSCVVLRLDPDAGWYLSVSETQRQKALDRATRL